MSAIDRLVQHIRETRFSDLPPQAVEAAKIFLLDTVGVGMAGASAPYAAEFLALAEDWGTKPEATVFSSGAKLPAPAAAMVNAFQIHNQEYDCVHEGAVVHAMSVITAAVLAHGERRGALNDKSRGTLRGEDLILALAVGVDIAAGLGVAAKNGLRFFRPATAGAFGAVAAIASLERFDAETLKNAFGLVYSQISGTMQAHIEGSPALAFQIAFAARSALTATDMAAAGLPGPHDVLEGPFGYFTLFETASDLGPVLASLGHIWRISELSHKPFPTGRAAHGTLDGLNQLRAAHGFEADDIASVVAYVPPLIKRLVDRPMRDDLTTSYARLCLPFLVATALMDGTVEIPAYRAERLTDPEIRRHAAKVRVADDGNPDPNAMAPQRLVVTLTGGQSHDITLPAILGAPDNPLLEPARLAKFRACAAAAVHPLNPAQIDHLTTLIATLETVDDASALAALTVA